MFSVSFDISKFRKGPTYSSVVVSVLHIYRIQTCEWSIVRMRGLILIVTADLTPPSGSW